MTVEGRQVLAIDDEVIDALDRLQQTCQLCGTFEQDRAAGCFNQRNVAREHQRIA